MAATINELAARLNLNKATVSRILNGKGEGFSVQTRQRVLSMAVEMEYQPNLAARALATGDYLGMENRDSNVPRISLVVPNLSAPVILAVCQGVERQARQRGYQVLLASSEFGLAHEQELAEEHRQAGVKGVILYPVTRHRQEMAHDYIMAWPKDFPLVAIDIACEEWPCFRAQFDNYRLGYDMTMELIRHGHRNIVFMNAEPDRLHSSIHERRAGWQKACNELGFQISKSYDGWPVNMHEFVSFPPDHAEFEDIVKSLLQLSPSPDAVIAWNDVAAVHLTQALINAGIRVPHEIRVTGFDNEPLITRLFRPLFPTSMPDFVHLGEWAVENLIAMIDGTNAPVSAFDLTVPILWREPQLGSAQESSFSDVVVSSEPTRMAAFQAEAVGQALTN